MAQQAGLKRVHLCVGAPPRTYEVSGEADVTAVVYRVGQRRKEPVTANFAFRKGEFDEAKADAIVRAVSAVLPRTRLLVPTAREQAQEWRYTTQRPAEGCFKPDFDDVAWTKGLGGFGTHGTPGAVVRTEWKTGDIWVRRTAEVPEVKAGANLRLVIHHDEDAEVYVNG